MTAGVTSPDDDDVRDAVDGAGIASADARTGDARAEAPRTPEEPRTRLWTWLTLLLIVGLAHVVYRPLLELQHFGWDTYPLIATSPCASLADLPRAFTDELMAGRYPLGRFYRPITSLAFALDSARSGFEPAGFHLTNHVILLAGVVAAFLAARRIAGGALGPLAAALVFALHPIHYATLPIAARRADMLSALFTMLLLAALPLPGRRFGPGRALLTFALAYAAAASKETGIVALPLVVFLLLAEAEGSLGERLKAAARFGAAPIAGVVLFAISRTIVLGGLGGHEGSGVGEAFRAAPSVMQNLGNVMLNPRPPLYGGALLTGTAVYTLLALWALRRKPNRPGLVLIGWFVALSGVTALAGELRTWYGCPYLPWYATLVGVLVAGLARSLRAVHLIPLGFVAPIALFLFVSPLRHSGLLVRYAEWAELSEQERAFLESAEAAIEDASPGTVVEGGTLPRAARSKLAGMRAVALETYSVQAWLDLRFPDRKVRLALGEAAAGAEEVVLRVTP